MSFTYQVTVDGDVHERQRLVNEAVHTTSDPGAKPASVTNTVVVKGASERSEVALSINPDRIETGQTTAATATVFSAGETVADGVGRVLGGHPPGRHRHSRRRGQGHGHAERVPHGRNHPGHREVPR